MELQFWKATHKGLNLRNPGLLAVFFLIYKVTLDEEGNTIFGDSFDHVSTLTIFDDFGLWLPRLRTNLNFYPKLKKAGATNSEISELLSAMDTLVQNTEGTTYRQDFSKIKKVAFYRHDSYRATFIPVEYLPASVRSRK